MNKVVGIPRALMYYRFGTLWTNYFQELGCEVVISDETDRAIFEAGDRLSVDECCLASKVYFGHVASLIGRCDALFIPSFVADKLREAYCTKFQSLPDLVANTFADSAPEILGFFVDMIDHKDSSEAGYLDLARRLGASKREAKRAYHAACVAQAKADAAKAAAQERKLKELLKIPPAERPPLILLVAHPYVAHDPFIGGYAATLLEEFGAAVFFADESDHERGLKASYSFSETMPWIVNRELIGSIIQLKDKVDGIVLMSAFPCGPDSMTNDAIARRIQGIPTLILTLDAQSGTAGLETRIESFVDILSYQQKGGYVHE